MHWAVAAPFFCKNTSDNLKWLDDFVPAGQHSFTKILRQDRLAGLSWHNRSSRNTKLREWYGYWNQSGDAWETSQGGIITVFPQLAATVALRKRLSGKHVPVVAWCFNIGACYPGIKQHLTRSVVENVDVFVVHSRRECETVSKWLKLPKERFEFVPLQRAPIEITHQEDTEKPFILAMGSANRDYQTFFAAVKKLGVRTVVVASQHALRGLNIPSNVEVRSGLSAEECYHLLQQARVSVVPLLDNHTAAGQVTIVEAMRMSRAVLATRCVGSEDYIEHNKTGLLVSPYRVDDLTDAIAQLWLEKKLRDNLAQEAGRYAETHFSDEVVGTVLGKILDRFC
jgi:glycosyltransferase involved in cell wall biosynthesis